jgi:hypothetical protein
MHEEVSPDDPVIRPWLVRALRKRPKLVNLEARDEFLARLEHNMTERRRPDNIGERLANMGIRSAEEAGQPVVRDQLANRFRTENTKRLRRL